jgi:hypothetical protein
MPFCRNHCRACGGHFTSVRTFDAHRIRPIRVGDLSVYPVTRCVRVEGREVQLANKEFVG